MSLLLFLGFIFFLFLVYKVRKLNHRLDHLEQLCGDLQSTLADMAACAPAESRKTAPASAAPSRAASSEAAPFEAMPEKVQPGLSAGAKEPTFQTQAVNTPRFQESAQEQGPAFESASVSDPDSLDDLILPDEEETPTPPAAMPPLAASAGAARPEAAWATQLRSVQDSVDWEQFTGVKLFAWLGGLVLFIAAAFFVKFSIDRNLVPPALRLALSALTGIGLILWAGRFGVDKYRVMRHTLTSGGIGVLYSVVFAATLYYAYLSKPLGFALLVIVSAAAFVLAVYHRSRAVSVLGALGAYATPVLVSTGQGRLEMLFLYLAVVNLGLYLVARRLSSQALIVVAAAGSAVTLGLGTWHTFGAASSVLTAVVWIANTLVFVFFLTHSKADPRQDIAARWTGILSFAFALWVAVALLSVPGWSPLLLVTAAQAAAMGLAWRNPGWYRWVVPYAALGFVVALVWVLFRFQPTHFSPGFVLLLLYGVCGGIGPLALIVKHGVDRTVLIWFRVFPVAIVLTSVAIVFQQPAVSFWFWPLLFGLAVIGIGISLLIGAFVQVGLLVLLFVSGALYWLFHVPAGLLGPGFFIFIMGAGAGLCVAVFVLIKRLPDLAAALHLNPAGDNAPKPLMATAGLTQWLAAAPAAGVCLLLAASFLVAYPHYPHPGMLTLVCFLALVLFAVQRFGFDISGVAALIGAAAAQAVFVFHAHLGPPVYFSTLTWSGGLFLVSLIAPFLFFADLDRRRRLWCGWAFFEAVQAVFIIYVSQQYWSGPQAQWVPLVLAMLKLPAVALLLRRLAGRPERNAILAFHGGVLLFYLSTLPVLVLDHGWIGLTFVFEAAALLWLNRRVEHLGLRWVALAMAPAGLLILFINLPLLKAVGSLPVANAAVLSVAAAVAALAFAVRQAGYPGRHLGRLDLPNYFLWLGVAAGFGWVNLAVADLFAAPAAERFAVWPGRNFAQWACYGLAWVALGGLLRRMVRLQENVRTAGFFLVAAGALAMIMLPLRLPMAAVPMHPFLNAALALYLPLLLGLYYLFYKERWDDYGSLIKNVLLAMFLVAALITLKFQKGLLLAPGQPFTLLGSQTPSAAAASAAGWMVYGIGLLIWPKRLDMPFRLVGVGLILLALGKALILPFAFRAAFAHMTPLFNVPGLVFLLCMAALIFLTLRGWDTRWPLSIVVPRVFWGILLAVFAFAVLNIEIAGVFGIRGRPFSMLTHGSLSMQLAYSIGWLLFAIGLLVVGIRWNVVRVRWAAIIAIVLTACKIFILDVSSLGQLYRVASLCGLAVVLMLVSFLYQRFLSGSKADGL